MTALDVRPDLSGVAGDDDFEHYFCCCTPTVALCGADLTGEPICEDECGHPDCATCAGLCAEPCILCGRSNDDPCACGRCDW